MSTSNTLKEILNSYDDPEYPQTNKINHDTVTKWMKEKYLNTLGALYSVLGKSVYNRRIISEFSSDEYFIFSKNIIISV